MMPEEDLSGTQWRADASPRASAGEPTASEASGQLRSTPPTPPPVSPQQNRTLEIQRIDGPVDDTSTAPTDSTQPASTKPGSPDRKSKSRYPNRQPDPVMQSLMLLVTMGFMLIAARFAVPSIVEEIRYAWYRGELRAEYESGTEGLKNVSLDALSEAYQMVTSAVGPSVVHIEVKRRADSSDSKIAQLLQSSTMPTADQGSGAVVDKDGYIVTNRHVIADGEDISVTLSDGRQVPAIIVGTDALTDLAVLKIEADGLMPIQWGDSDRCRVGSPVWAVGSPFGFDRSITFGILSGKHRMVRASTRYQDFMQSDVAVNPGNSGGPLVDARGKLIGINTAIVGDTYQGVSFSIPSSVAKTVYEQLRASGQVERGWLGVSLSEVPDDQFTGENHRIRGALVNGLANPNSPAARAGMKAGDVIKVVDGETIRDMGHLMRVIGNAIAGTTVQVKVLRDGEEVDLSVRLDSRPSAQNM